MHSISFIPSPFAVTLPLRCNFILRSGLVAVRRQRHKLKPVMLQGTDGVAELVQVHRFRDVGIRIESFYLRRALGGLGVSAFPENTYTQTRLTFARTGPVKPFPTRYFGNSGGKLKG